jgi:hypothetical protein
MRDLQRGGMWFQMIVDPARENRGFRRGGRSKFKRVVGMVPSA